MDYTTIILLTLFGFLALAAMLLWPVYRFLRSEERASRKWTREEMAKRRTCEPPGGNGRGFHTEPERGPAEPDGPSTHPPH